MTPEEVKRHNMRMIKKLCEEHGCSDKIKAIHFEQMVHRAWNPHPSEAFVRWWSTQPEFRNDGVNAVRARNCKVYYDRFKEDRQYGIA